MIFSVISSVLIIISIVCLFGLTPEQVTDDLMKLITPNDTMRNKSRNLRGNKKKHRLYRTLVKMKTALAVTGKSKQFTIVCCASLLRLTSFWCGVLKNVRDKLLNIVIRMKIDKWIIAIALIHVDEIKNFDVITARPCIHQVPRSSADTILCSVLHSS